MSTASPSSNRNTTRQLPETFTLHSPARAPFKGCSRKPGASDAVIRRAAEAGAEIETEPKDQFYGERSGWLRDPSGHRWNVGHFLEEVTPEEMQRRFTAMMRRTDT